jgi:hypothetical protein
MTNGDDNERLDELGLALIRTAAMTDAEVDRLASSLPFARVRARLDAEREWRLASAIWLDILMIGRRAVPAMLTAALALTGWFWLENRSTGPGPAARGVRLEREWLTGVTMFSEDDMLALLINGPVAKAPSRENQR